MNNKATKGLIDARANITFKDPDELYHEFLTKHGPEQEDNLVIYLTELHALVMAQNTEMMGLRSKISHLNSKVEGLKYTNELGD